MQNQNMGEELYNLLAELLNRKLNRTVLDSVRGEYGVLRYLMYVEDGVSAGQLTEHLHVVPGRMTDILKSLEKKKCIVRKRNSEDMRCIKVSITDKGKKEEIEKRKSIRREYEGMFKVLGEEDTKELIRLLKIVLAYPGVEKD